MADLHDKSTAKEFYENRYEEGYMEEWDDSKKNMVREIIRAAGLPAKGRALDFGCGNGVFTKVLKETLPDWDVYGVEISKTAVLNAGKRLPQCKFFTDQEADQYAGSFDLLFSHHVIEHVQSLDETFGFINRYLKPQAYQIHILPCGNPGSLEHTICTLRKNGIEKNKDNRFFFEEPGHLRRLTSAEFATAENKIGFTLQQSYFAGQEDYAVNWITKSSPRFVKKLTDSSEAINAEAAGKLQGYRKKLLGLTYRQFARSKYLEISYKWKKKPADYIKMAVLFFPSLFSKPLYNKWQKLADDEWNAHKQDPNGSEMFLVFKR